MMCNKKGFSLISLMVGAIIAIIAMGFAGGLFIAIMTSWSMADAQIAGCGSARIAIDKMARVIREGRAIQFFDSNSRIQVALDPNHTPTDVSDDVVCEFLVSPGNQLIYDPDITITDNEQVIARNVYAHPVYSPIFSLSTYNPLNQNIVEIAFSVQKESTYGRIHSSYIVSGVKMRNQI